MGGPNGQKFTEFTERDAERGEEAQEASGGMQFDMSTTSQHEQVQATVVRDSVRRTVRGSLLLASVMWFVVFVSTFFADEAAARRVGWSPVPVSWQSSSVWPHAIAVATEDGSTFPIAFIADQFHVYRVTIEDGNTIEVTCDLNGGA